MILRVCEADLKRLNIYKVNPAVGDTCPLAFQNKLIEMKRILIILISFIFLFTSCTVIKISRTARKGFKLEKQHSIETLGKYHTSLIQSNSVLRDFYYDKAFYIKNVYISDSLFSDDTISSGMPFKSIKNPFHYIRRGNEKYLVIYRNYIGKCCDWWGAESFIMLFQCVNNKPNKSKSSIVIDGGQLPNYYWNVDSIIIENDTMFIVADFYPISDTDSSNYFKTNLIIDSTYTIENYRTDLNEYKYMIDQIR